MGRGSTPSGSEDPSWPPSPPSSTWGEEVLRLDRRIHPGFPLHLPADVDHQAGVRRVRPIHCPPQVLLSQKRILGLLLQEEDYFLFYFFFTIGRGMLKDVHLVLLHHCLILQLVLLSFFISKFS